MPPRPEQSKIADAVDALSGRIATVLERENTLLEKLRELRASLISEVVTGKIDVRDSAAESSDSGLAA